MSQMVLEAMRQNSRYRVLTPREFEDGESQNCLESHCTVIAASREPKTYFHKNTNRKTNEADLHVQN